MQITHLTSVMDGYINTGFEH